MDALFFLLVIAGLMIILFIFGIIGESRNRKAYYESISSLYGKKSSYRFSAREKEHICSYLTHHRYPGQIDNITWNDLQMDAVFEQIITPEVVSAVNICIISCILHKKTMISQKNQNITCSMRKSGILSCCSFMISAKVQVHL